MKAANTDCWKKALNLFLNICDDVYRWKQPRVDNDKLTKLIKSLDPEKYVKDIARLTKILEGGNADEFLINRENFEAWKIRITK